MEQFDAAEKYMKSLMVIPINIGIKEINYELSKFDGIPGLILMVTGGQAIEQHFRNNEDLRTHDFDLKLIAPSDTKITKAVNETMLYVGELISNNLLTRVNLYIKPILEEVKNTMKQKFDVELRTSVNNNNDVFMLNKYGDRLNTVSFKMKRDKIVVQSPLIDVYVVNPVSGPITEHFKMFTNLEGSDPILSQNAGKYYIPYKLINDVPYAKLGYLLWDTIRMIEFTKKNKLPKYQRYVNKRNAIINGLDNPGIELSCSAMKDYINKCDKEFESSCVVKGKNYYQLVDLITLGIGEGLIPSDPEVIKRIRNTYTLAGMCENINNLL